MDAKDLLTNRCFCPMPWVGLMYNFDGAVKNCIRSGGELGNIADRPIEEILHGPVNLKTQQQIIVHQPADNCYPCYELERGKRGFDIISDRIFYLREFKRVPTSTYTLDNHELQTIDVRWSNLCNFGCVYCGPKFSSRWADELDVHPQRPTEQQQEQFRKYIFKHAKQLKHVYLAGGEPLLMKENLELLRELNPEVNLRINTNLSKVDTRVFEQICGFKNVHWTVSVETLAEEFEYVRYGGKWQDFLDNLTIIKQLDHKISFNMLWFLLNFNSVFGCVDFLQSLGFHNNSFVIGALISPEYLNIRNLPKSVLNSIKQTLEQRINDKPGYLLEDSYKNMLHYIQQPFDSNLQDSFNQLEILDQRRGLDSSSIFKELYKLKEGK